ncbi:Actin protein 2/3 complex subunit-like protein [Hirschfeldia incana]|nr:Actin protein 2/3 complex subunit-like protein [Hirschfeldia incana]
MNMDGPLDFENEDPLVNPPPSAEKRKKLIGLDDLLSDHYKEKSKLIDKRNRKRKASSKLYDSDDDDARGQQTLLSIVDNCQNQMNEICSEEDIQEWGLCMFGVQKAPTHSLLPDLDNCYLLKEFMNSQLNSVVDLNPDNGTAFLEGLLINGWLTKLTLTCARVETIICKWTLDMLLYSPKEDLRSSACDFWCYILLSQNEVNGAPVEIQWLPNYQILKKALDSYGFRINSSHDVELPEADSKSQGPPQNIRAWLKFVSACCQIRCKKPIFTASQLEQIAETLIWLLLDRGLQGLSLLLQECLISVTESFKEGEWVSSCKNIANSLASRVPQDMNCLRIVESVSGVDARSKHLRSTIANQMLVVLLDHKESDEKLMSSLMSINLKEKSCNLFRTYMLLVLVENWLLSSKLVEEKPVLRDMWAVFLRNCFSQINSTDLRPFASKVRTKASYLLQGFRSD